MKVLIAEDDRISALFLQKSLEQMGYQVVLTADGEEAWEALDDPEIRLVISDWMMPKLDGLELCRRIRAYPRDRYTYVLLLTAKTFKEDRLEVFNVGADDFLPKPLDRSELMARLTVARRLLAMEEELHSRTLELQKTQKELVLRNAALQELATSDALTGLRNRRYFLESLETSISLGVRHNLPLSVMMLDVDHFKSYNDTFGHTAGDEVLAAFAKTLKDNVRDHDVVARYGGEEFVILMPGTDVSMSRRMAERLREEIASRRWPRRTITASFGVATTKAVAIAARDLIDQADEALYLAKSEGRDRVIHAAMINERPPSLKSLSGLFLSA